MQDTQELIRAYLAKGGEIKRCQPSLAPVCVPVSYGPRGMATPIAQTPRKLESQAIVAIFKRRV